MIKSLALALIKFYQRHLSPYKGFCCAYRQHTGYASCSHLGLRAIRRYGVWHGLAVLRQRMRLCGVAFRRFSHPHTPPLRRRPPAAQRGHIDLGGCDLVPDFDAGSSCGASNLCDALSCCDLGSCNLGNFDWPRRNNAQREREAKVRLPRRNRA